MTTVVIWADRWQSMLDFYRSLLLDESAVAADAKFVAVSGLGNSVLLHRTPAEFLPNLGHEPAPRESAPIKPVFTVDSIVHTRSRVDGFQEPKAEAVFDGWSYCDGVDPDGNVIQVRWQ